MSLPIYKHEGKTYFFDARLRQLRNVDNPHDYIDLTSDEVDTIIEILDTQ